MGAVTGRTWADAPGTPPRTQPGDLRIMAADLEALEDGIVGADAKATSAQSAAGDATATASAAQAAAADAQAAVAAKVGLQSDGTLPSIAKAQVESIAADKAATATAHMATTRPGKNLYNPAADTLNTSLNALGTTTLADYRLTDYIPVTPGLPYTATIARNWIFYDANRVVVAGSYGAAPPAKQTLTAPAGAAYLRLSYLPTAGVISPETQQIEQSATDTAYEPYVRSLDPAILIPDPSPLAITRAGTTTTIRTQLGGKGLSVGLTDTGGSNSVFNFVAPTYDTASVHAASDDIAPLRTQQGTVGANHGLASIGRWVAGTHGKTVADLGSIWTDGTVQYVLLNIDASGHLYVGREYTIAATGEAVPTNAAPSVDLTHVSGATNTAALPAASRSASQLYPWVQRRRLIMTLDGRPVIEGEQRGHELLVRESYEILDYRAVYDWAKANIGQRYTTAHHKAAVGVETEWRIGAGGKMRLKTGLWEISPTRLYACGFLQAQALDGTGITRYLPGVKPIDGNDWDAGAPLAGLTTSRNVTTSDLQTAGQPPTVLVDVRADIAIAVGVTPWEGASKNATRVASTPTNLWDLRSTKKIYPTVLYNAAPGWGRIEVEGIRSYLTPTEAASVAADADPLSAWATLSQLTP